MRRRVRRAWRRLWRRRLRTDVSGAAAAIVQDIVLYEGELTPPLRRGMRALERVGLVEYDVASWKGAHPHWHAAPEPENRAKLRAMMRPRGAG